MKSLYIVGSKLICYSFKILKIELLKQFWYVQLFISVQLPFQCGLTSELGLDSFFVISFEIFENKVYRFLCVRFNLWFVESKHPFKYALKSCDKASKFRYINIWRICLCLVWNLAVRIYSLDDFYPDLSLKINEQR